MGTGRAEGAGEFWKLAPAYKASVFRSRLELLLGSLSNVNRKQLLLLFSDLFGVGILILWRKDCGTPKREPGVKLGF